MNGDVEARIARLTPTQRRLLAERLRRRAAATGRIQRRMQPNQPAPLSFAQERIWFEQAQAPDSPHYNEAVVLHISGPLQANALRRAFVEVVGRHDILRTRVVDGDNGPMQVIAASVPVELHTLAGDDVEESLRRFIRQHFDLGRAPLFRLGLSTPGANEYVVVLVVHHVLMDGMGAAAVFRECFEAYEALQAGRPARLPPPAIQYADYALWERTQLAGGALDGERDHWAQQADDMPPPALPFGRVPVGAADGHGARHQMNIPAGLAQRLRTLATDAGTTVSTVLLAAFAALLGSHAGQERCLITMPVTARDEAVELEHGVGLFINLLPLNLPSGARPGTPRDRFRDVLAATAAAVIAARSNQRYPFQKIVETLRKSGSNARKLTTVMFDMQVLPTELRPGELLVAYREHDAGTAKCDLGLAIREVGPALHASLEYATARFSAAEIALFGRQFVELLSGAVDDCDRSIADLLRPDHTEWLRASCGPVLPVPAMRLEALLQQRVMMTPDLPAVMCGSEALTFAELAQRVDALTDALVRNGVRPGIRVAIHLPRSVTQMVALFAALRAGAAYVPLESAWPSGRLHDVLAQAAPAVVIGTDASAISGPALLEPGGILLRPASAGWSAAQGDPDDAYVMFTSGSTGTPKGVRVSQSAVGNLLRALHRAIYAQADGRSLRVAVNGPLSFDTSVKQIIQLLDGHMLDVLPDEVRTDAVGMLDYLAHHAIDVLDATPTHLAALVEAGLLDPTRQAPKIVLLGGEPVPSDLWTVLASTPHIRAFNLYGPTECTVDTTVARIAQDNPHPVIGHPLANVRTYVVDENGTPVAPGMPGEIWIGGVGVSPGYLRHSTFDDASFAPDPWSHASGNRIYRSGDRVRRLADDALEFLGRSDDQVKLRGHRIEPAEIEAALHRHPWVREAAVVLRGSSGQAARLTAYVVPHGSDDVVLPDGMRVASRHRAETGFLFAEIFERGAYFRHGIGIADGATVLDVGANIGMFALAAHRAASGVRIHAFEPNPATVACLRRNLTRYGVHGQVHPHALGQCATTARFTEYEGSSILSGLHADASDRAAVRSWLRQQGEDDAPEVIEEMLDGRFAAATREVEVRSLSAVIAACGIERIDLLKINVEKAEAAVLAGIDPGDWPRIAQVALELHDLGGRLKDVLALLHRHGFVTAVEEDWSLEPGSGTNFYVYARRREAPALAPPCFRPAEPPRGDAADLRAFLSVSLPAVMVPADIVVLDAMPRTANGKLDRRALPDPLPAEDGHRPLATATEHRLAMLWAELLGCPIADGQADFFELGGHSLLATRLVREIRARFHAEIHLRAVFDQPTVAGLAALIDAAQPSRADLRPALVPDPAARHLPFPLTDVQQAYWFGRQDGFELGNVATQIYLELEDASWDLASLEAAWNRLIVRHDMLRAVVLPEGLQCVLELVPHYAIACADLSAASAEHTAEALTEIRTAMTGRPAPADQWPLFEIRASRLPGNTTRLHIRLDALIADAAGLLTLLREWKQALAGEALPSAPGFGFRDYVLASVRLQDGPDFAAAERYWTSRLDTLPPAPELPLASNPADLHAVRFVRHAGRVAASDWQRLRRHAAAQGVTPSVALLAAFAGVIATWSGGLRFTLNLTTFQREPLHPDIDRLVGDFTTLLLLEVDFAGTATMAERARRVQQQLWSDLDHRAMSGVRVLRALAARQRRSGSVLMPVVFTSVLGLEGEAEARPEGFGTLVHSQAQTPQVWLDHQVMEDGGELILNWDVVDGLFPDGMIVAMFAAYTALVRRLATEPEAWTGPLPDLLPSEQRARRTSANATDATLPSGRLEEAFLRQAASAPDAVAVIAGGRQISYGVLAAQAAAIAALLIRYGCGPDRLVAVVARKGWEQVAAVLGVVMSGAAYLPIDADLPEERLALLLKQGEVGIALTQSGMIDRIAWPEGVTPLAIEAIEPGAAWPAPPLRSDANLAYVIFTSGSTGTPKGVMIEHRAAQNTVADINARFGIGPKDRVLGLSSLSFDLSVWDIFGILGAGGTLVLPDPDRPRDPAHWAALARHHQVTVWNSVPALMVMLLALAESERDSWPHSLRLALLSGDWVPVGLPDRLRVQGARIEVVSLGGATEAAIWSIAHPIGRVDPSWRSIPYGRPLTNQRFHVLGADAADLPDHVPGELHIAGAGLARGYWRDPTQSAAAFIHHPRSGERLYRTGDYGRWLADGTIEFMGRRDAQVKVNGFRIELGEIEAALRQHPAVGEAVASAPRDAAGNRRLVAHIQPRVTQHALPALEVKGEGPEAAARLARLLERPGQRRFPVEAPGLDLPNGAFDADRRQAFLARQSIRRFLPAPVPLPAFAALLGTLQAMPLESAMLPKYRYPSAGSVNAVQCYAIVEQDRITGLPAGSYFYDPDAHRLTALGDRPAPQGRLHAQAGMEAGFLLVLTGRIDVLRDFYGDLARDFCLLEAGFIGQLLMTEASTLDIGLCPLGGLPSSAFAAALGLAAEEPVLLGFAGGAIDPAWLRTWGPDSPSLPLSQELRGFLRGKLPDYMVPGVIHVVDRLPLTANGKVDRAALADMGAADDQVPPAPQPPASALEQTIQTEAEIVLGRALPRLDSNFFELGASSLELVQLHRRLQSELARSFALVELFQYPSVRALAGFLSGAAPPEGTDDAVPARLAAARAEHERRAALHRAAASRGQPEAAHE